MMVIIIPTRGRTEQQLTLTMLPREWRVRTILVCPKRERGKLDSIFIENGPEVVAQPDDNWTIAQKRAWIMQSWAPSHGYDKILMLDDDLRFATRISPGDWHLRSIQGTELGPELDLIERKLGPDFPHVGFGQRQSNNTSEGEGWRTPGKMVYSLGYYLPIVNRECELGRIETREDMDVTLQLLRKGYPNAVYQNTVNDQRKFDAPGGATNERTMERSNADAHKLAELHPGYVSVSNKNYKSSVPRFEVICQWQKALQDGLSIRKGVY